MSDDKEQTFWDWKLTQSQHIRFYLRNKRFWPRIPYGQEDIRRTRPLPSHCPLCEAALGQLHLPDCDGERCPCCGLSPDDCPCDDVSFPDDP